jgi:hypothetical protein
LRRKLPEEIADGHQNWPSADMEAECLVPD